MTTRIFSGEYEVQTANGDVYQITKNGPSDWFLISPEGEWVNDYNTKREAVAAAHADSARFARMWS